MNTTVLPILPDDMFWVLICPGLVFEPVNIEGLDVGSTHLQRINCTNLPWVVLLPSNSGSHECLDWNRPKHFSCHPGGRNGILGKGDNPKTYTITLLNCFGQFFWGGHFPYTTAHHLGEFSQPACRMVKAPSPHLKHLP